MTGGSRIDRELPEAVFADDETAVRGVGHVQRLGAESLAAWLPQSRHLLCDHEGLNVSDERNKLIAICLRHEIQAKGQRFLQGRICGPPCLGYDKSDKIINRRALPEYRVSAQPLVELLTTRAQVAHPSLSSFPHYNPEYDRLMEWMFQHSKTAENRRWILGV